MNRWGIALLVLLFASSWAVRGTVANSERRPAGATKLVSFQELKGQQAPADPCEGKERCVVAYLAPWCPTCKHALPHFLEVRDKWKGNATRGIKFVIGADSFEKDKDLALKIGENAYVDSGDGYRDQMRVRHYPTVWVMSGNKVLAVDGPAYEFLSKETRTQ
jgi:thiol-disulfide isomerase/thioredoxin